MEGTGITKEINGIQFTIVPFGEQRIHVILNMSMDLPPEVEKAGELHVTFLLVIPKPYAPASKVPAFPDTCINFFTQAIKTIATSDKKVTLEHAQYKSEKDRIDVGFPVYMDLAGEKVTSDFYVLLSLLPVNIGKEGYCNIAIQAAAALFPKLKEAGLDSGG